MDPAQVLPMLVAILIFGVLGVAIGAIILRAAVSLYNRIVGGTKSPRAVNEPSMLKAMAIVFLTGLVNWGSSFAMGVAIGAAGFAAQVDQQRLELIAQLLSLPVSFLIMAAMLTALLPTTFGRGMLITLLNYVVVLAIVLAVGLVVAVMFGVFSAR